MPSIKHTVLAVLSTCALAPFTAGATGLGEINVISPLGGRFRAEIPLLNSASAFASSCFRLTTESPDAMTEVPWLDDAQIVFVSAPPHLIVSTRRQVSDPVVQFAIHSGCGASLTRHYTALLSPSAQNTSDLPNSAPVQANVRTDLPKAGTEPGRLIRKTPRSHYPAAPVRPIVAVKPPPLPKSAVSTSRPATQSGTGDRLVLMPSKTTPPTEPALPLATAEEIGERLSDVELQVVTMRARLNALRADNPAPTLAVHTVLVEMEARLLTVELNIARINLANLVAESPVIAVAASPTPDSQANTAESAEVVALVPSPAPSAPASAQVASEPRSRVLPMHMFDAAPIVFGLFGVFGLGLSVFLYRRVRRGRVQPVLANTLVNAADVPELVSTTSAKKALAPDTLPAPNEGLEAVEAVGSAADAETLIEGTPFEISEDLDEPIDLANVMLLYGRTAGAIEVLQSFIDANPKKSLKATLRLLEICKQADMRPEFEKMAEQLAHRFNIERVSWDETLSPNSDLLDPNTDQSHPPRLIGEMPPHIQTRISAQWGTGECLDFLRTLLNDNRNGARKGFSISVTHAILGLTKTLESELKASR